MSTCALIENSLLLCPALLSLVPHCAQTFNLEEAQLKTISMLRTLPPIPGVAWTFSP